ncbi:MAG: DUF6034 family protein [Lachnospiraceae bacterium]|nr:DUF6034 family protein [Lachnospiraceae bacterium]
MKNKKLISLLTIGLCAGVMAGCAKTPEESLVKQKGSASLGNYEEGAPLDEMNAGQSVSEGAENAGNAEGTGTADAAGNAGGTGSTDASGNPVNTGTAVNMEIGNASGNAGTAESPLRKALGAPERYQNDFKDATGNLSVKTDAVVEIPDANQVSAVSVSQHPFDQAQIDLITKTFFPDGVIYRLDDLFAMTKSECMAKLEELKGYVAQGNLDPYNYGTDENGNLNYDIYEAISSLEEEYENAPEERTLTEVTPELTPWESDTSDGESLPRDFYGLVKQPDETEYVYTLKTYDSMPMDISIVKVHEDPKTKEKQYQSGSRWMEYYVICNAISEHGNTGWQNVPTEEEFKNTLGITLEEAQTEAEAKLSELGLTDMKLNNWDYGILGMEHPNDRGDDFTSEVVDEGMILHYTRVVNQLPITYTQAMGGSLEDMNSDMQTWCYEMVDFVVTKDGIDSVSLWNLYDIGETRTENLSLMSFADIIKVYEKMILIQNAAMMDYAETARINIDRITFGYTRIYEPATSSQTGILVPAWDFFGGISQSIRDEDGTLQEYPHEGFKTNSQITINAIDGSIIDRSLGY